MAICYVTYYEKNSDPVDGLLIDRVDKQNTMALWGTKLAYDYASLIKTYCFIMAE